jgi:hypothetical protein
VLAASLEELRIRADRIVQRGEALPLAAAAGGEHRFESSGVEPPRFGAAPHVEKC